jgi:hypothetical protein
MLLMRNLYLCYNNNLAISGKITVVLVIMGGYFIVSFNFQITE